MGPNFIEMMKPNKKFGSYILKEDYERLANFITEYLKDNGEILLHELLDAASSTMTREIKKDYSFDLLRVKQDLVERGLIEVSIGHNRKQYIRLAKRKRKVNIVQTKLR